MSLSRRDVLKLGAGAAAFLTAGVSLPSIASAAGRRGRRAQSVQKKIPIGLQLYSIRDLCAKDLPGTLEKVAKAGYQGVEFAGYYNYKAADLRKLLDKNGLKCCGTHTGLPTLQGDAWKATVEFNKEIGNKFLIVPWLDPKQLDSVKKIEAMAATLTELAAKGKEVGMLVGYHAHGGDFAKVEGEMMWNRLFAAAGPDVVMQLDTGNTMSGGADPVAILKKFPGRSVTIHLKEQNKKHGAPVAAEGTEVKWADVFQLCETTGKTEWYIVEQEAHIGDPIESVANCLKNLKKLGR